jgi:hypothetical protein
MKRRIESFAKFCGATVVVIVFVLLYAVGAAVDLLGAGVSELGKAVKRVADMIPEALGPSL